MQKKKRRLRFFGLNNPDPLFDFNHFNLHLFNVEINTENQLTILVTMEGDKREIERVRDEEREREEEKDEKKKRQK